MSSDSGTKCQLKYQLLYYKYFFFLTKRRVNLTFLFYVVITLLVTKQNSQYFNTVQ
jgi:hypothetical protein